jgi:hypothetical protein
MVLLPRYDKRIGVFVLYAGKYAVTAVQNENIVKWVEIREALCYNIIWYILCLFI